jgi:aryl-alcohol dehydrogenase-like predicted oxidoreductase
VFQEYGYGATTFSPLALGILSGKYLKGIPKGSRADLKGYASFKKEVTDKSRLARVRALQPIAKETGCTLAQLSLAWCLNNPNVSTVIVGASRVDQLQENLKSAAFVSKLTPITLKKIDKAFGIPTEGDEE